MKRLELFVCEVCNTQYNEKSKALECEKSHKLPVSCAGHKYRSKKSNEKGYPDSVIVTFNDGSEAKYEYKGI